MRYSTLLTLFSWVQTFFHTKQKNEDITGHNMENPYTNRPQPQQDRQCFWQLFLVLTQNLRNLRFNFWTSPIAAASETAACAFKIFQTASLHNSSTMLPELRWFIDFGAELYSWPKCALLPDADRCCPKCPVLRSARQRHRVILSSLRLRYPSALMQVRRN